MQATSEAQRLREGMNWIIGLRWVATIWVGVGTAFAGWMLRIGVLDNAIYGLVGILAAYNLALLLIERWLIRQGEPPIRLLKRLIGIQMSIDLILLTAIFHFSGGVENPFIFFYVFHVLIAGILLSVQESCFQATVGVLLFGSLVSLEYFGTIPHHCLAGFVSHSLHQDRTFVFGTLFGFATAMYLVVYLGGFAAGRLRRAEAAQSRANEQLRDKDRIKDEYVYRVSHDIKGHLAAIQSCLSVVVQMAGLPSEERASFANRALERTRGLTRFVKDLLHLTYLRLNNKMECERFSFGYAVRHAVEIVEPNARNRSIQLDCVIPEAPTFICGSDLVVEEVVTNLLSNAIKYTPEGGNVTLTVEGDEAEVHVRITDTGVGIPAEEVDRVFDEFYRASNVRNVERDGTGMGLTLVKHIVERHGGRIALTSELGKGTCVNLVLPCAPPSAGDVVA